MSRLGDALRGRAKEQKQEKERKKKPAQILADRFRGHHKEKKVDWKRDVPQNVPQAVKDRLDAISIEHSSVREQLHALRASRGTREVGSVKVPPTMVSMTLIDDVNRKNAKGEIIGVERRGDIP